MLLDNKNMKVQKIYKFFCVACFLSYFLATPLLFLFVKFWWCHFGSLDGGLFFCRYNRMGVEWYEVSTELFFWYFSILFPVFIIFHFVSPLLFLKIFTLFSAGRFVFLQLKPRSKKGPKEKK